MLKPPSVESGREVKCDMRGYPALAQGSGQRIGIENTSESHNKVTSEVPRRTMQPRFVKPLKVKTSPPVSFLRSRRGSGLCR